MKKILLAATDMGGGNILLPIITALAATEFQLIGIANEPALSLWQENGFTELISFSNGTTVDLADLMSTMAPDLIITGTSIGSALEQNLWQISNKLKIPSLALIDGWSKLADRFYFIDTYVFPQHLGLIDNQAYNILLHTLPSLPCTVHFIGQPHLQSVIDNVKINRSQTTQQHISFFSMPLVDTEAAPGIHALEQILPVLNNYLHNPSILIKPHPREEKLSWVKWHAQQVGINPKLQLASHISTLEILTKSRLVIGLPTSVLLEASFANIPIITLAFNIADLAPYPATTRYCSNSIVTRVEQFASKLNEVLYSKPTPMPEQLMLHQSSTRAINVIMSII